jgi:hypothetical protein
MESYLIGNKVIAYVGGGCLGGIYPYSPETLDKILKDRDDWMWDDDIIPNAEAFKALAEEGEAHIEAGGGDDDLYVWEIESYED